MRGKFNEYGGQYVSKILIPALNELEREYEKAIVDEGFKSELNKYLKDYVGRPSSLYYAENLSKEIGGAKIYLKREDLNHTGSHNPLSSTFNMCTTITIFTKYQIVIILFR